MTSPSRARTWLAGVTAVGLLATSAPAVATPAERPSDPSATTAPPSAAPAADTTTQQPDAVHSVTLVTGDVVTVTTLDDGTQTATVESAPDASGRVLTHVDDDELMVIPHEALPYLAAGVMDQDLFNMSLLIDQGYADEDRATIPVIVQWDRAARGAKGVEGADTTLALESIGAQAMETDKAQATDFWQSVTAGSEPGELRAGVARVHLDRVVEASLTESVPLIGADQAWEAGLTGEGVTVAVLDTGADLDHPDLVDVVTDSTSFVPDEGVEDANGHGTHVASTIAGSGAASAAEGGPVLKGVAPDADLVVGKVLGDDGYGMESWIIDGMEWAAERADVVNMSLGNTVPDDGTEPMAVALQQLSEETGTLFVVASGNLGRAGGVGSPGSAEAALTVAATDKAGNRAYFSDHGPRLGPEGLVKPDLSAPGQEIVAARSQSAPGEGWYFANTGTSMATPHVAGAAAILAQQEPDWTGQQLKDALMSSTKDLAGPWDGPYQVGTGIVDVPGALGAQVVATGSVSFGFYDWPHEGDAPVTREVTYTNVTDAPIDLAVQVRVPEGVVLPEGLLSLSADTVTVPAGGTASVEVTVDPELAPVPSALSGWVVASAGDTEVARTGWGVAKEEERYDVTLRATDRDGSPGTATVVYKRAGDFFTFFTTVEGEQTLRLPGGPYSFTTFMDVTPAPGETGVAFMGDPVLDLTGDVVIDLDAREAAEISVDVPDASVAEVFRRMEFDVQAPVTVDGFDTVLAVSNAYLLPPTVDRIYAGPITEDPEVFEYRTRWRLRTPFIEVSEDGTVLDVHGLGGAAMPAADAVLPAVYAGTGTQSEVDAVDAAGAAVVVTRDRTQPLWDVASRIETAGAELVVVVNDEPGDFVEGLIGPEGQELGIPAVGMSGTQGAGFVPRVEAGEVELTLSGGRTSPVVYDLVDPYAGTVPADLRYAPSEDELVRIDSTYHGDRDRQGGEFRYDFGRFTRFGLGFHQVLDVPQERVEWVSAQEHTEWYQDVVLLDGSWNERGTRTSYEPGARTSQDWLAAVVQPRLGEGYWLPNRQGNYLQVNLPSWAGDEPTHTGGMGVSDGTDDQVIRWYDGDTLLQETVGWQSDGLDLVGVTERTQLRVTNDVARDPAAWPTSVRSSTEWTFWTEAPADWFAELPFVQVDFEVDTDVTGTARSAAADTIGLSAWLPPGTALAGEVVEGSLAISYDDGDTWQDLELTGDAGDWTAEVVHPVGAEHASLRGTAVDDMGNAVAMEVVRAFLIPDAPVAEVERVAGTDRYGTAALLAGDYAPGGVVYVASGADHADALSAAALAGHGEVPVLLTRPGQLPDDTRAELERLEPADIVVVGGEVAVAEEVVTELEDLTDGTVTRLSGPDRYGTAAEVAGEFGTGVPVAYVASGRDFPDALAGGARAGALGGPVLLTRPGALPEATLAALEELAPERIVLLGGTGAVSDAVAETLEDVAAVERTYGTDRYGTAAEVAGDVAPGAPVVYLATGRDFPDALSGSAVAGAQDAPVLLTRPQQLPEDTVAELLRLRPARVVLLGGTGAIESVVEDELEELLAGP